MFLEKELIKRIVSKLLFLSDGRRCSMLIVASRIALLIIY